MPTTTPAADKTWGYTAFGILWFMAQCPAAVASIYDEPDHYEDTLCPTTDDDDDDDDDQRPRGFAVNHGERGKRRASP